MTPTASDQPQFPDELRGAAAQAAGGWIYAIDPAYDPRGYVPPEGIVGAWKIGPDGEPTGEFIPNPNHRPTTAAPEDGDDPAR